MLTDSGPMLRPRQPLRNTVDDFRYRHLPFDARLTVGEGTIALEEEPITQIPLVFRMATVEAEIEENVSGLAVSGFVFEVTADVEIVATG